MIILSLIWFKISSSLNSSGAPETPSTQHAPLHADKLHANSFSIINWGQQAHTEDNQNTNFQSNLLYYTKYTNVGQGIIQVDNMIYNFGLDNITFLNVPWGGVRNSVMDFFFHIKF